MRSRCPRRSPDCASIRRSPARCRSTLAPDCRPWIESGAVQVDGRPLRGKDRVLGGEQVRIARGCRGDGAGCRGDAAQRRLPGSLAARDRQAARTGRASRGGQRARIPCRTRCWRSIRSSRSCRARDSCTGSTRTRAVCCSWRARPRRTPRSSRRWPQRRSAASTSRCAPGCMTAGGTIDAAHRPSPYAAHPHGGARRRPSRGHPLPRARALRAHTLVRVDARDRPHPPDPRASRAHRLPRRGRSPRTAGAAACLPGARRRSPRSCTPFRARRCTRHASRCAIRSPAAPCNGKRRCRRTCSGCWRRSRPTTRERGAAAR